jgi:hypothetical protein
MDHLDNQGNDVEEIHPELHFRNQDWAIITVPPSMYLANRFRNGQFISSIEGYMNTTDITQGEVYICSTGISGGQKGTLKMGLASVFMGQSVFHVKTIFLEHELSKFSACYSDTR